MRSELTSVLELNPPFQKEECSACMAPLSSLSFLLINLLEIFIVKNKIIGHDVLSLQRRIKDVLGKITYFITRIKENYN